MTTRASAAAAALCATLLVAAAEARAGEDAVLRVVAEEAPVHTGPGAGFRIVYRAARGDVLRAVSRATQEHWFQVQLPDGTYGWIFGDEVLPLEVDSSAPARPPGFWSVVGDAIFSPAPLPRGDVGLTFSAGVLGGEGMVLFRPAYLVEPHVALEGHVGETVGDQLDILYFGAGANAFLWPQAPVTPFLSLGGGGAYGRKKADQFTIKPGRFKTVEAGGGLLVALKKRITLRFDFRQYVLFDANDVHDAREYSGGLCVVF